MISKQTKIGAIVILAFCAFFILAPSSSTSDSSLLSEQYRLVFESVPGLQIGGSVKLAGVNVGSVTGIDFCSKEQKERFGDDANVVVSIATDYDVVIPEDSSASINTETQGKIWVEIIPGLSAKNIDPDQVVRLRCLTSAVSKLESGLGNLRSLRGNADGLLKALQDPHFRRSIGDLASNSRFYSTELKSVSAKASGELKQMNKQLDTFEASIQMQISRIDVEIVQAANQLSALQPQIDEKFSAWNGRIAAASVKLKQVGDLAVSETERFGAIAATADKMTGKCADPALLAKLHKLADKLDNIAALAEDLHGLTSAPEAQQALKDIAAKYRAQSQALRDKLAVWDPQPTPKASASPTSPAPQETNTAEAPSPAEAPQLNHLPATDALPTPEVSPTSLP